MPLSPCHTQQHTYTDHFSSLWPNRKTFTPTVTERAERYFIHLRWIHSSLWCYYLLKFKKITSKIMAVMNAFNWFFGLFSIVSVHSCLQLSCAAKLLRKHTHWDHPILSVLMQLLSTKCEIKSTSALILRDIV